jgi:hypothetical protein
MQDQAAQLAQTVSVFKLDGAVAVAAAAALPAARPAARPAAPKRAAAQPKMVAAPAALRRPSAAAPGSNQEWEEF